MSTRKAVLVVAGFILLTVLTAGEAFARKEALLSFSQGQLPTDTTTDATRCSLEEQAELGGRALKVVYAAGESFGDRVAKVTDWKQFISLQFDALNPSQEDVRLTLTVKHQRTTSFQTRVDVPVVLKPGKNSVQIGVDEMVNVNGSLPDLANVSRWYIACEEGTTPTVYFADVWLVGGDAAAAAPAVGGTGAVAGPAVAYRVTGTINNGRVDLIAKPVGGTPVPGAPGVQSPAAKAKPRATALLHVSGGQLPNDTGGAGDTKFSLEEKAELGGQAMKVVYAAGDSFGGNPPAVKDWRGYLTLEFDVFNPGQQNVSLTLTVKHKRSTSFQTRVDLPFAVKPGKTALKFNLDEMTNVNGSAPDFSTVNHWYVACQPDDAPTLYFGDFWLSDAGATRPAPGTAAAAAPAEIKTDPARLERIRAAKMPKIAGPVMFNTPEADAILSALEVFPPDNPWNQLVDDWPLHPNSDAIIASIGADKPLRYNPDMCFILVPPDQQRVEVKLTGYPGESDPGPYPLPENVPIEGWPGYYEQFQSGKVPPLEEVQRGTGGDRHGIVVDPVGRMLYEFFVLRRTDGGWEAAQASIFDLKTNKLRPLGWTSADAAGLPIFPAVVRYDEIRRGMVEHAMRVTIRKTRRDFVAPATHYASPHTNPEYPRMGERIRLKADFDVSGFSPPVQAILKGMKRYGMFVADNGIEWAISVSPDPRIPNLHAELRRIKGSAFEVVVPPQ